MMGNKWVQAGLTLGAAVGLFVGAFLSAAHPLAPLVCAILIGFVSMWIGSSARGTDGWGGPFHGPQLAPPLQQLEPPPYARRGRAIHEAATRFEI